MSVVDFPAMFRIQTASLLILALTLSPLAVASKSKSRILGSWERFAMLVDGKVADSSTLTRQDSTPVMVLRLSLKGQKVTVTNEVVVSLGGGSPFSLSSESITFDLSAPARVRLKKNGPTYITTAALDDLSFIVKFVDEESGQWVKTQRWTFDEAQSQVRFTTEVPGEEFCSATPQNPGAKASDVEGAQQSANCRPVPVYLYKRY